MNNMGQGMMHLNTRHILRQIYKEGNVTDLYRGVTASTGKQVLTWMLAAGIVQTKRNNGWNYF